MAMTPAPNRIAERKLRDQSGPPGTDYQWSNVTVRRLSGEILYSQPVLYAHFGSASARLLASVFNIRTNEASLLIPISIPVVEKVHDLYVKRISFAIS
jgi:hypothetical protein